MSARQEVPSFGDVAGRTYQLIVEGELSDQLEAVFEGMTLTRAGGTTTLSGHVRDQAELQGLLQRVSDLGLTLLEVKAATRRRSAAPARAPSFGDASAT